MLCAPAYIKDKEIAPGHDIARKKAHTSSEHPLFFMLSGYRERGGLMSQADIVPFLSAGSAALRHAAERIVRNLCQSCTLNVGVLTNMPRSARSQGQTKVQERLLERVPLKFWSGI